MISPNIKPNALAALTRTAITSSCNSTDNLWLKYSAECCCWLEPECKLYNSPMIQAALPRISGHWLFKCGRQDSIKSDTWSQRSSLCRKEAKYMIWMLNIWIDRLRWNNHFLTISFRNECIKLSYWRLPCSNIWLWTISFTFGALIRFEIFRSVALEACEKKNFII